MINVWKVLVVCQAWTQIFILLSDGYLLVSALSIIVIRCLRMHHNFGDYKRTNEPPKVITVVVPPTWRLFGFLLSLHFLVSSLTKCCCQNNKLYWLYDFLTASAYALEESERVNGENGWYVPQQDGSFEWIDMDEAEEWLERQEMMEDRGLSTTPVKFYLYTQSNPTKGKKITASASSISGSNFNADHPTRYYLT